MDLPNPFLKAFSDIANSKALFSALGIDESAQEAVYSSHDIARLWLAQPDREMSDSGEGFNIGEDHLPNPMRPFVPGKYTSETQARLDAIFSANAEERVSTRPMRIPLSIAVEQKGE